MYKIFVLFVSSVLVPLSTRRPRQARDYQPLLRWSTRGPGGPIFFLFLSKTNTPPPPNNVLIRSDACICS
jgi:hypothetical protein